VAVGIDLEADAEVCENLSQFRCGKAQGGKRAIGEDIQGRKEMPHTDVIWESGG